MISHQQLVYQLVFPRLGRTHSEVINQRTSHQQRHISQTQGMNKVQQVMNLMDVQPHGIYLVMNQIKDTKTTQERMTLNRDLLDKILLEPQVLL
jgi:hypothetical protein